MDDANIVQLYFDRDKQAITETATKYGNYCASIAKNILGNHEDTEECVNDTYLNAWNAMPPHRPKILATFLGKIVRNLAFNRYKHNTAAKRGAGELPAVLDELGECVSDREDVEEAYDYTELIADINAFLSTLPTKKRNVFVRRYWYADSLSDIAQQFSMSESKAKSLLFRLRKQLKKMLEAEGITL